MPRIMVLLLPVGSPCTIERERQHSRRSMHVLLVVVRGYADIHSMSLAYIHAEAVVRIKRAPSAARSWSDCSVASTHM